MNATSWKGVIDRYREFLPVTDRTPVVTLNEGGTPLIPATRLQAALGIEAEVYLKCEGLNPTGSFKDRGMTVAVSKAVEEGARAVICASTGNTSASASAYAARAGLRAFVLIPEGKIALGKLSQAMIHGAQVFQIEGNFDQALGIVRQLSGQQAIVLVNSLNPYRIEGQKSAAFEICDRLGRSPDYHFIPVGNAGNITAYWKGYQEYFRAARIDSLPKMMGWQAEGAAPIVHGKVVERPETVASAIQIGNPASWRGAVEAARESGGRIDMVSDGEIIDAYRLLAHVEGIFCELASAAPVAGLIKFARANRLPKGTVVVCVLTGHGLKDPDAAIRLSQDPVTVKADAEAVLKLLSI
ncbi:MAG: threonine synthase [candidate division NC10 bacterium]|nr:threonine synthase [candidate division NC10 bacterium]